MPISQFDPLNAKGSASQPQQGAITVNRHGHQKAADRLSRSQALLLTAGLAGLIGLGSGAVIRFSLANSPNARFLSPLQTFPALSNWTPELPQNTADSHYLPGGTDTYGRDDVAPLEDNENEFAGQGINELSNETPYYGDDSLSINDELETAIFDSDTFDSFAARQQAGNLPAEDPLETLENGPSLSADTVLEEELGLEGNYSDTNSLHWDSSSDDGENGYELNNYPATGLETTEDISDYAAEEQW